MTLRNYKPEDCAEIAKLFYETVHTVNRKDYSDEQIDVWATGEVDLTAWNDSLLAHHTIVAEEDGVITGFGDIAEDGYLDRLYVHHAHQGRGIATAICDELEQSVNAPYITTHASITARGFFEKRGYCVRKEQQVERSGVFLTNYVMERKR